MQDQSTPLEVSLYGASGHAKVIIEIVEMCGGTVNRLFDDDVSIKSLLGYPVYQLNVPCSLHEKLIISIGNNIIRKRLSHSVKADYTTVVHPRASISKRTVLGDGTVIMSGVTVNSDTKIGRHCILNTNCSVDHDCIIDDYVHVAPNVALCGNVHVGEGVMIGAGAVVIPGITIGRWSTIGAGSVVTKNVFENTIVAGNPATPLTKYINRAT